MMRLIGRKPQTPQKQQSERVISEDILGNLQVDDHIVEIDREPAHGDSSEPVIENATCSNDDSNDGRDKDAVVHNNSNPDCGDACCNAGENVVFSSDDNVADNVNEEEDDARRDTSSSEEDLDQVLANMDIDRDFDLWHSFRNSMSEVFSSEEMTNTSPSKTAPSMSTPIADTDIDAPLDWQADLVRYQSRWQSRDEVYSHRYKPSDEELQELKGTQVLLGLSNATLRAQGPGAVLRNAVIRVISGSTPPSSSSTFLLDGANNEEINNKYKSPPRVKRSSSSRLIRANSVTTFQQLSHATRVAIMQLLKPTQAPYSIVLQRGPVISKSQGGECELVLLTQGLVLARILSQGPASNGVSKKQLVRRQLARAWLWKDIAYFTLPSSTEIVLYSKNEINDSTEDAVVVLQWPQPTQQDIWRQALEKVYTEHAVRTLSLDQRSQLGWQYEWMRRPAFYMAAVSDVLPVSEQAPSAWQNSNELDTYNGYAPLHYAVRLQHAAAVQCLLQEAKVDPNLIDKNGRTPMYYAISDNVSENIAQLLVDHGAKQLSESEVNKFDEGALFGQVEATEAKITKKKQAEQAQAAMAENMRLMKERGEKIEEIDSKARDLNEGARNYAEMASQLKERSKKKWYQL